MAQPLHQQQPIYSMFHVSSAAAHSLGVPQLRRPSQSAGAPSQAERQGQQGPVSQVRAGQQGPGSPGPSASDRLRDWFASVDSDHK